MFRKLEKLYRDISAVAYIEFALIFPILLLMFAGGVELTRYIQANQKVDSAAVQLANYVSQVPSPESINFATLSNNILGDLMAPFDPASTNFVVSGIYLKDDADLTDGDQSNDLEIRWQEASSGGAAGSRIGGVSASPTPPDLAGLKVESEEYIVAVEVFHNYENIIPGSASFVDNGVFNFSDGPLYKRAIMRYRLSAANIAQDGTPQTPEEPVCCGEWCDKTLPVFRHFCECIPDAKTPSDIIRIRSEEIANLYPKTCSFKASTKKPCTANCPPVKLPGSSGN